MTFSFRGSALTVKLTIGSRGRGHDAPRSGPPSLLVEMTTVVLRRSALLVMVYASMIVCTAMHATNIFNTNGASRDESVVIGGSHPHLQTVARGSHAMRAMSSRHRDIRGLLARDGRRDHGDETFAAAVLIRHRRRIE